MEIWYGVGIIIAGVMLGHACSGSQKHDVDGKVTTEHQISIDLEMCKETDETYRKDCVDKFLDAWQSQAEDCGTMDGNTNKEDLSDE
jgi:hypothetical protein